MNPGIDQHSSPTQSFKDGIVLVMKLLQLSLLTRKLSKISRECAPNACGQGRGTYISEAGRWHENITRETELGNNHGSETECLPLDSPGLEVKAGLSDLLAGHGAKQGRLRLPITARRGDSLVFAFLSSPLPALTTPTTSPIIAARQCLDITPPPRHPRSFRSSSQSSSPSPSVLPSMLKIFNQSLLEGRATPL